MTAQNNVFGLVERPRKEKSTAEASVRALQQAATRLAELRRTGPRFKTKDLVGLLLSHGARSWRATMPVAHIRVSVMTPDGKAAVRIRGIC